MINQFQLMIALLTGLSNPSIERSLSDLDSPYFHIRNKATQHLVNHGEPYFFRVYFAGCVPDMSLEKTTRVRNIADRLYFSICSQVEASYVSLWMSEGEYADFLFGKDWPDIQSLMWRDTRLQNYELLPPLMDKYFWYNSISESVYRRKEIYALSMYINQNKRPYSDFYARASTKVWIIDELNKGTNPLLLSIVLADLKACQKSAYMEIDWWNIQFRSTDWFKVKRGNFDWPEMIKIPPDEID